MKTSSFLLVTFLVLSSFNAGAQRSRDKKLNEFIILGTLGDYMGRNLDPRNANLVDRYGPEESTMISIVDSLIKSTYPTRVYKLIEKKQNTITSDSLARRFNAFYDFKPSGSYTAPGRKAILCGSLKEGIFHNETEKLAFLAGAFIRFGNISDSAYCISIANSTSKARVCKQLLQEFGCRTYYNIRRNYIPVGHNVFFHPTPKVLAYLKLYEPLYKSVESSRMSYLQNMLDEARKRRGSN